MSLQQKLESSLQSDQPEDHDFAERWKEERREIAKELEMTPAATSYHLGKLKKADLLYESRYKNFIFYELNLSILDELVVWLKGLKGESPDEKI